MVWTRNYHTHTCYCDGTDTPRDIVLEALAKGMTSIGFSGHSHTSFDETYCMMPETAQKYRAEILALREEFAEQIEILCGLEYDFYSDETKDGWDYRIGSVHYVEKDGCYLPVDESLSISRQAVREHYGGDVYAMTEAFYENEANVVARTGCDIIGHFDLIKKFNRGQDALFDEHHPRYVRAWQRALDELLPYGVPFEINTTPMTWWVDGDPYPSREILEEICRRGGRIAISTDSHQKETLDRYTDEALALAWSVGFRSVTVMSMDGPRDIPIGRRMD